MLKQKKKAIKKKVSTNKVAKKKVAIKNKPSRKQIEKKPQMSSPVCPPGYIPIWVNGKWYCIPIEEAALLKKKSVKKKVTVRKKLPGRPQ